MQACKVAKIHNILHQQQYFSYNDVLLFKSGLSLHSLHPECNTTKNYFFATRYLALLYDEKTLNFYLSILEYLPSFSRNGSVVLENNEVRPEAIMRTISCKVHPFL